MYKKEKMELYITTKKYPGYYFWVTIFPSGWICYSMQKCKEKETGCTTKNYLTS